MENNDQLNSGTRIQVAPELVDTYRISTNNFSAESGRAAGFVANAATKSGSNAFHGVIYSYLGNDALNANTFQDNLQGAAKRADKEVPVGFQAGGPVRKDRLWFSTGFEKFRDHGTGDPQTYLVPGALAALFLTPGPSASLLQQFPSPGRGVNALSANVVLSPTVTIDQRLLLERLDYRSKKGDQTLTARFALSRQTQPDFNFSPYPGLNSGSLSGSSGIAVEHLLTFTPSLISDLRLGWNSSKQELRRAHPEIPTLQSADTVTLPGSGLLFGFTNRGSTWELNESLQWIRGRHIVTIGGGMSATGSPRLIRSEKPAILSLITCSTF